MESQPHPDRLTLLTAEEVLRTIYGDDLTGCTVSVEQIAAVLDDSVRQREIKSRELAKMYDTVIQTIRSLSTPPDSNTVRSPAELQAILSERLDAIHSIAVKTIETTAKLGESDDAHGQG